MAYYLSQIPQHSKQQDNSSNYGSEFGSDEEELLNELLSKLPTESKPEPQQVIEQVVHDGFSDTVPAPRMLDKERRDQPLYPRLRAADAGKAAIPIQVEFQHSLANVQSEESRKSQRPPFAEPSTDSGGRDTRSPLERFRTAPQKALSVTDIISPSWCELQYWYTLTKHGRKKRTPAMRQGSMIHKTLEDQVYKTVAVPIETKEDAWGLRIWNVIQGLQTLRETGLTRELEIWGVVDGLVINGVVDEISYICPDRELELQAATKASAKLAPQSDAPQDQSSITDFLKSAGSSTYKDAASNRTGKNTTNMRKVYLTDVKTRGIASMPKAASFRPTLMQLMLYHKLFSNLVNNKIDSSILFGRYNLNTSAPFTDGFIAQLGNLNEVFHDAMDEVTQESPDTSQDSVQILLGNNSLKQLWALMIQEFQRTVPSGSSGIGDVLKAEYRNASDGSMMGAKTFLYDDDVLQPYLDDEIGWWKGEREAQGVVIEEAYKCRSCEFADECTWRKAKIDEATKNHRSRTKSHE
ncbi:MAG: hypothetical protein M1812_007305 [Candelaria pacifica]|nr:MAG: hypothetical protein M1812_007305 [Candelaria pacifica]